MTSFQGEHSLHGVWLCTKELRTSETRLVPRLSGGQPGNKSIVQIIHRWSKTPWEVQDSMGSPRVHACEPIHRHTVYGNSTAKLN